MSQVTLQHTWGTPTRRFPAKICRLTVEHMVETVIHLSVQHIDGSIRSIWNVFYQSVTFYQYESFVILECLKMFDSNEKKTNVLLPLWFGSNPGLQKGPIS